MRLKGRTVTVVGLGKSGAAACRFLKERGAKVRATDAGSSKAVLETAGALRLEGIEVETGAHTKRYVSGSSLVVTSPGVPRTSPPIKTARQKKIPVISEIELGSLFCRAPIIAVTGSNGKTTTSHLIYELLRGGGRQAALCGNVGYAFLNEAARLGPRSTAVLELSSFQLEDSPTLRPRTAVVLNIAPNHLDRHRTMRAYIRAKERIFANQRSSDTLVLNFDDPVVRRMAGKARSRVIYFSRAALKEGVYLDGGAIQVKIKGVRPFRIATAGLALKGAHNLENIMAALAAVSDRGLSPVSIRRTLERFRTLEHRIEPSGTAKGVNFVNDSKSTTVESTEAAIRAVRAPLVLVAGGRDKGASFSAIEPLLLERARAVVLYGEARGVIRRAWPRFKRVTMLERFDDAVRAAFAEARPGDTLLLSPMCTSFDQFSCYEERGEVFKHLARQLGARGAGNGRA